MNSARIHPRESARGFTLIEISIVVGIVLMLLTLGIGLMNAQLSSASYSITKKRQEAIKDALIAYLGANKRLPCPYAPVAGTVVTGVAPAQSGPPLVCPTTFGVVPFATLGLSREMSEDGWGNLFSYRVYADSSPACPTGWDWANASCFGEGKDGVTPAKPAQKINDGTVVGSAILITDRSIAVVISHGTNGLGAWAAQGTRNAAPTTCEESHNAAGTTLPSGCTITVNTYYKGERSENDDVVAYLTATETIQTLVKQGTIKSPAAKVNDDLQTLVDTAIGVKRAGISGDGASVSGCSTSIAGGMATALSSLSDPWGLAYGVTERSGNRLPICIFSRGSSSAGTCTITFGITTCNPPAICRVIDTSSFNGYLAKAGLADC